MYRNMNVHRLQGRIVLLLSVLWAASCFQGLNAQRKPSEEKIGISRKSYEIRNDSIRLEAEIRFEGIPGSKISGRMAELSPVLEAREGNKTYRFQFIAIPKSGETGFSPKVKNGKRPDIKIVLSAPFEEWMKDADLVFVEKGDKEGEPVQYTLFQEGRVSKSGNDYSADYKLSRVREENVEKVSRGSRTENEDKGTAGAVRKDSISYTLSEKKKGRFLLDRLIRGIQGMPGFRILRVDAIDYASVEDSYAKNEAISGRRAGNLASYIRKRYALPAASVHAEGYGENWKDLKEWIAGSELKDKSRVLRIIDTVPVMKGREKKIMDLNGGATYRLLMKDCFPLLRKNTVIVSYSFSNEGNSATKTEESPAAHSGGTADPGDSMSAEINASADEIQAGNGQAALKRLFNIQNPAAWNNMGIAYLKEGDRDSAEYYLRKAAADGNPEASYNLGKFYSAYGKN